MHRPRRTCSCAERGRPGTRFFGEAGWGQDGFQGARALHRAFAPLYHGLGVGDHCRAASLSHLQRSRAQNPSLLASGQCCHFWKHQCRLAALSPKVLGGQEPHCFLGAEGQLFASDSACCFGPSGEQLGLQGDSSRAAEQRPRLHGPFSVRRPGLCKCHTQPFPQ